MFSASQFIPVRPLTVRFFSTRVRNLSNKAVSTSSTTTSSTRSSSYSQPLPSCESAYASDEHRQLYRHIKNVEHLSPNELHAKIMKFAAAGKLDSAMVVLDALSGAAKTSSTPKSTSHTAPRTSKMMVDPSIDPFASTRMPGYDQIQAVAAAAASVATDSKTSKTKDDVKISRALKLAQAKLALSTAMTQRNVVAADQAHSQLIALKFAPVGIEPVWHFLLESYCDMGDSDSLCRLLRQLQQCRCALRLNVLRDLVTRLNMRGHTETASIVVETIGQLKLWQAAVDDAWKHPDPFEL